MDIIDANKPLFNTVIFYILIVVLLLIIKPEFMYCNKENKFKAFGLKEGECVFSFPVVAIGSGVILYLFFMGVFVVNRYLEDK